MHTRRIIGQKTGMNILNEFFDRIYCVTVHDFVDRHELVKTQLKGIHFEWIFSPPAQYIMPGANLSSTEISLIIGHLTCIWNARANGYHKIAIWEDDGVIVSSEKDMKVFFDNLPPNWDCLYMGNASWNEGIEPVRTSPVSEYVNRVAWGTGSGFNAIQQHAYDTLIKTAMAWAEPIDFNYYTVFGRGNSYAPSKGYFSDPISMPNEHCLHRVTSTERFIPSRIVHGK